jgi:hypothetical protein
MLNLPYSTLQDIAAELKRVYFPGYYSLPYNRFEISQSSCWWLSPTHHKVAFPYGKIIFTIAPDWFPTGKVFCGFNVEKGLTSKMGKPENCIMDESWFWHRFVERAGEPLAGRIKAAGDVVEQPIQVLITAGELVPNSNWSRVLFEVSGNVLSKIAYSAGDSTLEEIANVDTFIDFAAELRKLENDETAFQWIDILIGCTFSQEMSGADDLETCAELLRPFETWMVG